MRALLISVLLSCAVLMFPYALRSGLIALWILSVLVLIILGTMWPKIKLISKIGGNDLITEETIVEDVIAEETIVEEAIAEEAIAEEAIAEETVVEETVVEETVAEEALAEETVAEEAIVENTVAEKIIVEETISGETIFDDILFESSNESELSGLSIDELIDLGFREKQAGNFNQASRFFLQALGLNPVPDLALCLIMDCYWLLNNMGDSEYSLIELNNYVKTYLAQLDPEPRRLFDTLVIKENLSKQIFND
ncbi:hypothetical protein [Desulfosporosinus meridiei]|uniref:Tetratricopeptide repeat protein n=1 Tax=Desulfosporosinus meridiei (strain ATCC BAA-275 / DSM 13257 / KCTC 12902 / NCIMB 13706 / S10) TaxID=768704 RepID=J7ISF1_DESMD|nr:hypothetical protein [Desulfosporosinus meridiei]AFQ44600.1 hypothetical protein Desmer_2688 [Desulfosporosinus meridiei DSM 13257]